MALNLSEENVGVVSVFRECKKNHTLSMGVYIVDGCMAFVPDYSKENGMVCRGCGCYRSFHRIEVVKPAALPQQQVGDLFHREEEVIKAVENPQLLQSEEVIVPPADPQPPVRFFHREEVINPAANQEPEVGSFSHSAEKMNPVANPQVGSLVPNDHGQVHGSGSTVSQIIDLTGEDDENLVENQAVAAFVEPSNVGPNSISTKPKRKMKNYSQEETAKMVAMAWELELKMPGRDKLMKAKLEAFCREMGVKWLNFKAWLHTHKKELILGRCGR